MADFFDDLIPQQQGAALGGFDDLIPKSQFSNVQSGAESVAAPEKPWYEKAYDAVAEIPEGAYEGLQAGGSELGKWATLAGSVPAMAYDAAKGAVTGEATTQAQDWMFGNLVQPQDEAAQYNREEIAKKGILGQVAGGVGMAVPDVGIAIAGGGATAGARAVAPLVESGSSALMRMLAETAGTGVRTAAPLAEKAAAQRYGEAIAQGKSQGEATGEAIKAIATTTAMGLTGSGGVGRLGNTVASGLGGEVVREMEGRPFDPAELGTNLALGFGLSGRKQEAPRALNADLTVADQRLLASDIELPPAAPDIAPRSPVEQRMAEFGLFADLIPESTQRPLDAPARPTDGQPVGQDTPAIEGAPESVQTVTEGTGDTVPLSATALRIKEANERSLQETGSPLAADQIRSIREQEPTGSFDLWEDTVAELKLPRAKEVRSKDSVLQELKYSFGSDFAALDQAMQSGKFKILDGTELPDWVKAKNLKVAPRGWRDAEGNVAIVADSLEPGYVRPLIFHEIGVHAGIQQSKNYDRVLSNVHRLVEQDNADAMRAVQRMQAQKTAGNKLSPAKENQELVAYFVQGVAERMQSGEGITSRAKSAYGKIKADVKNLLSEKFGLNIQLTDKDMYYMALGEIRKFGSSPNVRSADADFATGVKKDPQTSTRAFRNWFGDSKVVDAEGEPSRVYHGTNTPIDSFDPAKRGKSTGHATALLGDFFSASPKIANEFTGSEEGANIVPVFLSVRNPYKRMHVGEFQSLVERNNSSEVRALRSELEAKGFDGMYIKADPQDQTGEFGADTWISFHPEQIKSATGNRGTFDPNDPRIDFSVGDSKQPTATPDDAIVPNWKRKLQSVFSWKGGNRFASEYERAALESATGDFLAERSAKLFDKAGFRNLSDNQRETARAALNGDKGAEAALSPKARAAVRFTRDEITNYQSKLASQGVKMDGRDMSDMLYDSMAKDSYTTRAYGVYEIKPTKIDSIAYALSGAEKEGKPFWRWRQEKKNPETVKAMTRYIEENLIDPSSNRSPDEQVDDILNQLADPRGFTGSNLEVVKQAARDSSILMARDKVPAPIRNYWGEFKDPRLQAAFTLSRLGALTAKQTMLNNIWKANQGKLFFEDGSQPKGFTAKLPENHDYGPLAGKMTRPDIAQQIETMTGIEKATPGKVEAELGSALWNGYVQVASMAKVTKTVFSAATSAVNAMANTFLMSKVAIQQTLMGQKAGIPELGKTMNVVVRDFLGNLDSESAKKYITLGIIRDSAQYGELKKLRSKIQREADREGSGAAAKAGYSVFDGVAKTFGKTADLYQIPDNAARLYFFLGEMAIQKKLHPDWTQAKVETEASNRARDQVPTWGRAAPAVKFTSRAAGNFATWSAEVIRSTKNQVKYGLNDLVHGETAAQKYYGLTQLIGTASYMAAAQAVVPAVISAMFGFNTDDKKKNEAVARIAPEYFGGDTLAVASADPQSGKIVFLNSTRLDPSAPFHQLLNREMQAIKDDKSIPEATWGWIKDAFLTPGPLPQGAAAAITGENKFGQKLAPDERMKAVVDAFKPGTLVTASKIDKLKKRGVDPRVIQAAQMGLPLYDFDTKRAMYFSAMDFTNDLKEYRQQFNRGYGAAEATPEQQKSKYTEFLRNEKDAFDKLNNQVKALETIFGQKEGRSIALEALKGAKLDKDYQAAIKKGTFTPNSLEDSKTFLDTQEKAAIYADPSREKEIRKDFADRRKQLTILRRNYQNLLND